MAERPTLRVLGTPFTASRAVLRMLEPPEEDQRKLLLRLLMGSYQKPFLIEDGTERSLEFNLGGGSQSAMRNADPDALIVPYTREMMAFLFIHPNPRHVVVAGLGGGSLVKYCHRYLPKTRITAIEINPWVISLGDEFCIPADDERLTTVCADARDYFARSSAPADVVLIDLYDRRGAVPFVCDRAFLTSVGSHLIPGGCVVFNVVGADAWCKQCIAAVRAFFGNPVVVAQVEADGNVVLLAFKGCVPSNPMHAIKSRTDEVKRRFQLEFPAFLRALR